MKQIISFCLKRLPLLILLGFLSSTVWSQDIVITGKVTDSKDGTPIIGASIVVKGTTIGTSSDTDGNYSIKAKANSVLVISYIGYETIEEQVNGRTLINFVMLEAFETLDEIVVIGYGQVKRTDVTGSITTVSSKDFNKGNNTTPLELLMGRTAGVQITTNSGSPGDGATIRIRGGSSLRATNDPLIILDGIPLDYSGIGGVRNPLSTMNPNDIESFTVLKDASATAIYGSRASNGVIIITTKKGRKGAPLKLNYNANLSYSTVAKKLPVYSADEFRTLVEQRVANGEIPAVASSLLGNSKTEWFDEIFRPAVSNEHNISATGSYKFLPYRVSVGYNNQNGILDTDRMSRINGGISLNPKFLKDDLSINLNINGAQVKNHFADWGAIGNASTFDPTQPVKFDYGLDDDGNPKFGGYFTWLDNEGNPNVVHAPRNPVALLQMRTDESDAQRVYGNIQADYRMPFLRDLSANINLGYDYISSEGSVLTPRNAAFTYPNRGFMSNYTAEKKNELLDFYLNYAKNIDAIDSRIDIMGGYSWQHFWYKNTTVQRRISPPGQPPADPDKDEIKPAELYLVSFFGRMNYTFKEKYLLTATLRNDHTSRFSPETRSGFFPSFAFAWKVKEESFLRDVDIVSDMKLRLGYGVTGQQDIDAGNYYVYLPTYQYGDPDAQYLLDGTPIITARPNGYDYNIKWEETVTQNIGIDFSFLKNRIEGSFDYYLRKTNDLINRIPVAAGTNFTNYIITNVGNLENKGFEIFLLGRPVVSKDLYWEVSFNLTHNKNEITKLTAVDDPSYLGVETGGISGGVGSNIQMHSVGYPASTFFVYEQIYDKDGKPIEGLYVDRNKDGMITEADRYWFQNPAPSVFMGFGTRVEYKNFDFSFNGRINLGNFVYNNISSTAGVMSNMWHPSLLLRNLTKQYDYNFNSFQYFSNYYIENASFMKMDNISLGYNFNNVGIEKLKVRVSLTVQNPFMITNYRGIDPEINGGIDNNMYPRPRTFVFGLGVDF